MEEYLKQREELIAQDRALRPDYTSAIPLSVDEQKADEILRNIRTAEAESVWNGKRPHEKSIYGPQQMFPGMEFLTGITRMGYLTVESLTCSRSSRDDRRDPTVQGAQRGMDATVCSTFVRCVYRSSIF